MATEFMNVHRVVWIRYGIATVAILCIGCGVVARIICDRDSGLRHSEVLVDMRTSREAFDIIPRLIRVAVLDSPDLGQASEVADALSMIEPHIEWMCVDAEFVRKGLLCGIDVILVAGGNGRIKGEDLGEVGRDEISDFVARGGGYVGICAGAFLALKGYPWSLGLVNAEALEERTPHELRPVSGIYDHGVGKVSVRFSRLVGGIFQRMPMRQPRMLLQYSGGPLFCFRGGSGNQCIVTLARFGPEMQKANIGRSRMMNRPAIIATKLGKGTVVLFSPHPEVSRQTRHIVVDAIIGCRRSL